jgi:hypothetical protein
MADPTLLALLVQRANVWHVTVTEEPDGQLVESYTSEYGTSEYAAPAIADLPCLLVSSGKAFQESAVGALVESDAIMYTEQADLRETDRVEIAGVVYRVHAGPSRWFNPFDGGANAAAGIAHIMETGLRKWQP